MNREQWLSVIRDTMKVIGTFIVSYGFVTSGMWETITGAAMIGVPIIFELLNRTKANTVAVVAAMPEVARVEIKPTPEGTALKEAVGSKPDALVVFSPR